MAIRSPTSASERELVLESQVKDLEELLEGHPGKGELYRQRNNFMEELRLNRQRVTELELAVSKKDKQLESLASELGVALDEQQRLRYQLDCAQLTLMEMQKDDPVDQKEEPQRSGPSTTSLGHSQATTNVTSFEERAKELEIWEKALKKKHSELDLRLTELQFLVQRRPALLKDLDVLFKEVVVLMKLTKEAQVAGHVREQCQRIDDIARHLLSTSLTNFEKRYLGLNVSVFPGPEAASTEKKLPYSPLKGPNTSAMRFGLMRNFFKQVHRSQLSRTLALTTQPELPALIRRSHLVSPALFRSLLAILSSHCFARPSRLFPGICTALAATQRDSHRRW
eukprot:TRINITY_DN20928_c0_g1_i2.p1 TRINITY_DN20928_c0_g1~~TRINITY_DN20928_c0_g1_i2.p1  ORF type:complete len:339 (-),score=71.23 TRINITY_DN20928_c0_g1_i2:481-1497(-)